jgi:ATP-binding protein involved in chromosome partitioning
MLAKVNVPILGLIENMSYFLCPGDGRRYDIFGSGGGVREAARLQVPLLGQVPLEMALRESGDLGVPLTQREPDSESARIFRAAAEALRQACPIGA